MVDLPLSFHTYRQQSGIIYCITTNQTEELCADLQVNIDHDDDSDDDYDSGDDCDDDDDEFQCIILLSSLLVTTY